MPSNQGPQHKPSRSSLFKRIASFSDTLSFIAGIITVIATISVFLFSQQSNTQQPTTVGTKELEELKSQATSLSKDLESLKIQVQALSQVPDEPQGAIQLSRL